MPARPAPDCHAIEPQVRSTVSFPASGRVFGDTGRRFAWLVAISVVLHLPAWPSLFALLGLALELPAKDEAPPKEALLAIPVELFDAPVEAEPAAALPQEDPVALIEEIVVKPVAKIKQVSPPKPPPVSPKPPPKKKKKQTKPKKKSKQPKKKSKQPKKSPKTKPSKAVARKEKVVRKGAPIKNPLALDGDTKPLVASNARIGLTLDMAKIRNHALGARISRILPALPQWRDFFDGTGLSPVKDIDRFFLAGPSLRYSGEVLVAFSHRAGADKMRQAVNKLVEKSKKRGKRGEWTKLSNGRPAAFVYADRAPRLVGLTTNQLAVVVPPRLEKQLGKLGLRSVPQPGGGAALVASIRDPQRSFRTLGIKVPATLKEVRLQLLPLSGGRVRVRADATDASPAAAKASAKSLETDVNAALGLITGLSGMLGQLGFGSLGKGADLPNIHFLTRGKDIYADVTLSASQVNFIVDRIERQLIRRVRRAPVAPTRTRRPAIAQ